MSIPKPIARATLGASGPLPAALDLDADPKVEIPKLKARRAVLEKRRLGVDARIAAVDLKLTDAHVDLKSLQAEARSIAQAVASPTLQGVQREHATARASVVQELIGFQQAQITGLNAERQTLQAKCEAIQADIDRIDAQIEYYDYLRDEQERVEERAQRQRQEQLTAQKRADDERARKKHQAYVDRLRRMAQAAADYRRQCEQAWQEMQQQLNAAERLASDRQARADESLRLAETRGVSIRDLQSAFQRIEVRENREDNVERVEFKADRAEDALDAALASAVASYLRGLVAAAEGNDSTAISIPTGIRVASATVATSPLGEIEQALNRITHEVAEGREDSAQANAQQSAAWALCHGLLPHPDDLATLLRAGGNNGQWAGHFDALGDALARHDEEKFRHGQLQARTGGGRLEVLRTIADSIQVMGPNALIGVIAKPTRPVHVPAQPPAPSTGSAASPDLNAILDDLF